MNLDKHDLPDPPQPYLSRKESLAEAMFTKQWLAVRPWRRHSTVLLVAGLAYVGIGISYILTEPTLARTRALEVASSWWSLEHWGLVFIASGVLAVISARWPPFSQTWGYMVLTGLSTGWGTFYLTGIIFVNAPISGISSVLIWYLIGFMWWAVSGLLNPGEVIKNERNPRHYAG